MAATTFCTTTLPAARSAVRVTKSNIAAAALFKAPKASTASRAMSIVCDARNNSASSSVFEAAKDACKNVEVPSVARPALISAVANLVMSSPAHAGVLFDFNLTLPIIMGQFLILMVILDKVVFGPVGEQLDKRDGEIRGMIDNSSGDEDEITRLREEARAIKADAIRSGREEIEIEEKKAIAEGNAEIAEEKAKLAKEMAVAMASLQKKEQESRDGMQAQVDKLADVIADKILTEGDMIMDADNKDKKKELTPSVSA